VTDTTDHPLTFLVILAQYQYLKRQEERSVVRNDEGVRLKRQHSISNLISFLIAHMQTKLRSLQHNFFVSSFNTNARTLQVENRLTPWTL